MAPSKHEAEKDNKKRESTRVPDNKLPPDPQESHGDPGEGAD
jgi:hypothetical protein